MTALLFGACLLLVKGIYQHASAPVSAWYSTPIATFYQKAFAWHYSTKSLHAYFANSTSLNDLAFQYKPA